MRTHAILLAGGSGDRFGAELPKQFVRLAGERIIVRSLRSVAAAGVEHVVIVAHPDWVETTRSAIADAGVAVPTTVVAGGRTRNESTLNGLASLDADDDDVIVVHDAVRPLVPVEVVVRAIEPVRAGLADGTDTVISSADTLVIVDGDAVIEIPDRSRYRRGQTPQVFRKAVLAEAYAAAAAAGDLTATDDCSLVLRYVPGARIKAVAGDEVNLKITTRIDLVLADRMLQMRTVHPTDDPDAKPASLAGARVLVIGGTNGIGKGIADAAREQGAVVEVDARSLGLDVRDYATVAARVDAAAERLGGLDHVVVTAGVLRIGRVDATAPESLAEVIDVNLTGSLNVARAAYPHLRASRGSLTVFASSSFTRGRPDYVAYSASKAAIVNLAQGLAEEWAEDGHPGQRGQPGADRHPDAPGRLSRRRAGGDAVDAGGRTGDAPTHRFGPDRTGLRHQAPRFDAAEHDRGPGRPPRLRRPAGPGPLTRLEYLLASTLLRLVGLAASLLPIRDRVVLATARKNVLDGNLLALDATIRAHRPDLPVTRLLEPYDYGLTGKLRYLVRLVRGMVLLRTSRWFIVDNAYLPIHVMGHRRGTSVIQVWHAVGALKRFGWDARQPLTDPERRFLHRHYDWVVSSAEASRGPYAAAFRVPVERVLPLGSPRVDAFADPEALRAARDRVLARHPSLAGRTVVLYAPTFRGRGIGKHAAPGMDAVALRAALPPDHVLVLKTHPNLDPRTTPTTGFDLVADPTDDLNDLLAATDVLVTDYSSSIFEWAILRRPLVLLVPDLEAYERDPGLYLDYRTAMIGDQVTDTAGVAAAVLGARVDDAAWSAFVARHLGPVDGRASERFVEHFLGPGKGR